ncbi:hypothetical protein SUGI_0974970 [Cryptomeria japonica]|uniref:uncharacterized protein LOC131073898 n=1 Tax=Cryptomeria japonica TaxID=3369 RepID=UPI0024149C79|nr:uncharacterized protein LOC131073898 [Cryptomeria japonica]GLJ46267.1 hypothetical protein SUGI_0974970 [Cryptomeria japonica]
MTSSRSALALISICFVVCLSGLGDCSRVVLKKEQVIAQKGNVGEKEQSVHLLLPTEKEEFIEITRETQPLKPDLRVKDGIFWGERSKRFRFGCHHGKFKRWGHGMNEHKRFPFDFHPRAEEFWHLRQERGFDCNFHGHGHEYWHRHGHEYEEPGKEERQADVKEKWFKTE